jgi:hypothetical protein
VPQGWYLDPYGRHELRWFSDGRATALVKDNGVTAQDAPPDEPPPHDPVPPPEAEGPAPVHDSTVDAVQQVMSAAYGNVAVQPQPEP